MPDKAASLIWIDVNGRTRQTIIKTLSGSAGIQSAAIALTLPQLLTTWESFLSGSTASASAGTYQSVADAASLRFQTAMGSILRLTVPGPNLSVFLADQVTIDPTNALIGALVSACIGSLSDGAGNPAVTFLGGRYVRGTGTDLDSP